MSGLFGGGGVKKSTPEFSSLRVSTATYGRPIPIIIGKARVAAWVMWYGDFKSVPHEESQGGKGGGSSSTSYTYQAAVQLGLCETPVDCIGLIWRGSDVFQTSGVSTRTITKTESVIVRSNLAANLDGLGGTVTTILSCQRVVKWDAVANYVEGVDYTTSGSNKKTLTFLDSAMAGRVINVTYTTSFANLPVDQIGKINATLFKGAAAQAAWPWLVTAHPTQALAYDRITYIASPLYELGSSSDLPNTSVEVDSVYGYSAAIRDCNPRDLLTQYLTNPTWGALMDSSSRGDWRDWSTYCQAAGLFLTADYLEQQQAATVVSRIAAATNADFVVSGGVLNIVPYADQAVTNTSLGITWTPNLVAQYELAAEHFAPGSFKLKRKDPLTRYNALKLRFRNRQREYNEDVVEVKDDGNIALFGLRAAPDVDLPEVKEVAVAQVAANLMLQRAQNIVATYQFRLPFRFALLEAMDLVALTYAPLGLTQKLARITQRRESDWWLDFEAEEVPVGVASAITYPYEPADGYKIDTNVAPGNCNTPVIFEGPAVRAGNTGVEVFVAARGDGAHWGGCQVWTSLDGVNYKQLATLNGASRFGSLSASFGAGAGSVAVAGLGASQLLSGSPVDAANLTTLCFVGSSAGASPEFFAYETATLTGAGAYTLSGLVRAAYGTADVSHASGSVFVRVDDRLASTGPLDATMVGKTLYVKCLSFNQYGAAVQSLADVSATTYTITGLVAGFVPGTSGKGLVASASSLIFQYPKTGGVSPAGITFTASRRGALEGAVTWSVVSGTATLSAYTGDTVTLLAGNLTTDTATVQASVTDPVATYTDRVTVGKVREGADGASAPLLVLLCTAQTFTFDKFGLALPTTQSISCTAALQNTTGTATFVCTLYNSAGASIGTPTMGGSGNTRTLTVAQFGAAAYAVVTATLSGLSDTETFVRLKDGSDSIVSDLDNQAVTLTCDSGGTPVSYVGAVTTMKVYAGLTDDSANWSFSRANSTGVTSSLSGATLTVTNVTAGVDSGYVDITATRAGYTTQVQRFYIGKSKSGVTIDKLVTTVTNVSVTAASHVPDNESFRTAMASITYTPPVNCAVTVTASGIGEYVNGTTGSGEVQGGIYISGAFAAQDSLAAFYKDPSTTWIFTVGGARNFTLSGGVTYTFVYLAKYLGNPGDTCVFKNLELTMQAVK